MINKISAEGARADVGRFLKNYGYLANPLSSTYAGEKEYQRAPHSALRLAERDDLNYALWNALGAATWAVPLAAATTWLANRYYHNKLKKKIAESVLSRVNSDSPVLSPEGDLNVTANITERPKREINEIKAAMKYLPKIGSANDKSKKEDDGSNFVSDAIFSAGLRSIPFLSMPILAYLTTSGVHSLLKDKYGKELDETNNKLQNLQDKLDMQTLKDLQYIRAKQGKKVNVTPEEAKLLSNRNIQEMSPETVLEPEPMSKAASNLWDQLKGVYLNLPVLTLLATAVGGSLYGTHYFLPKQKEMKKLKLLEKKILGRNRTLNTPNLTIELPEGYEENMDKKKQEQLLPGIELAEVLENPKKDAFLG